MKLPCLYLIDSIVKNLGQPFVDIFADRLAECFCTVYISLVDEKIRKEFIRVYTMWYGIFTEIPLRDIEERLRLKRSKRSTVASNTAYPNAHIQPHPSAPAPPPVLQILPQPQYYPQPSHFAYSRLSSSVLGMLNQLRSILMAPPHAFPPNALPDTMYRLGAIGELDPLYLRDLDSRCRLVDTRPALDLLAHIIDTNASSPTVHPLNSNTISSLLPSIPIITSPKQQQQAGYHAIYESRPKQCKVCGIRFSDDQPGKDAYATHLDAHFRRNMRLKDRAKKVMARDWLPLPEDWVEGKIQNTTEKQVSVFFDTFLKEAKEASKGKRTASHTEDSQKRKRPMVRAGESDRERKCPICTEQFEIVFDNDQDEWMFADVVEDTDGQIIHYTCTPSNIAAEDEETLDSAEPSSKRNRV